MRRIEGFTLVEMLIAVIIVGASVAVFFQLISASLRLEKKSRVQFLNLLEAKKAFHRLQRWDIRDGEFPWEGSGPVGNWEFRVEESECFSWDEAGRTQPFTSSGIFYKMQFLYDAGVQGSVILERYIHFPAGFFREENNLKNLQLREKSECAIRVHS